MKRPTTHRWLFFYFWILFGGVGVAILPIFSALNLPGSGGYIFLGVLLIAIRVVTCWGMFTRKLWGWYLNFGALFAIPVLKTIIVLSFSGNYSGNTAVSGSAAIAIVWLIYAVPNAVYFQKRKHLFDDGAGPYKMLFSGFRVLDTLSASKSSASDVPSLGRAKHNFVAGASIVAILVFIVGFFVWESEPGPNLDQTDSCRTGDDGYTQSVSVSCPATNPEQTVNYQIVGAGKLETGATAPNSQFTDHGDRTVIDDQTGLEWVQAPHALSGNSREMDWRSASNFCANLVYAGHSDWRLPSTNELMSVHKLALPAGSPFVDVRCYGYWSGTSYAYYTGYAWLVYMHDGDVSHSGKSSNFYVWPVRGGQ